MLVTLMISRKCPLTSALENFLDRFRLGKLERFAHLSGNFQSSNYLITTTTGAKTLLKLFSPLWSKAHIEFDISLLQHMANSSSFFPVPLYALDGTVVDIASFKTPAVLLSFTPHQNEHSLASCLAKMYRSCTTSSPLLPPLSIDKFLIIVENTLPEANNDSLHMREIFSIFKKRMEELLASNPTLSPYTSFPTRNSSHFLKHFYSFSTDFLFIHNAPILTNLAFHILETTQAINISLLNEESRAFHKKYPLAKEEWDLFPQHLIAASLLKILLTHLKKILTHEDPFIDGVVKKERKVYESLLQLELEVA